MNTKKGLKTVCKILDDNGMRYDVDKDQCLVRIHNPMPPQLEQLAKLDESDTIKFHTVIPVDGGIDLDRMVEINSELCMGAFQRIGGKGRFVLAFRSSMYVDPDAGISENVLMRHLALGAAMSSVYADDLRISEDRYVPSELPRMMYG